MMFNALKHQILQADGWVEAQILTFLI